MEYQRLDRDDIRKIFDKVLLDKGLETESNDLEQLFTEFLEMDCTFDFSQSVAEQVERQAEIFWDQRRTALGHRNRSN